MLHSVLRLMLLAALLPVAAHAQLNGVYTCANGNPGNAYDYADIGDFFTALEVQGVTGPVTLDVFDDGGQFQSKPAYTLVGPIAGVSAANPLVIKAAAGERPVISGAGVAMWGGKFGAVRFIDVSFTTVDGLELKNCGTCGIAWTGLGLANSIRISRCRFHSIAGNAIAIVGNNPLVGGSPINVTIENNWMWDCLNDGQVVPGYPGVVSGWAPGQNWDVRHNTVVFRNAMTGRVAFYFAGPAMGAVGVRTFMGNVIHLDCAPGQTYGYCVAFGPPVQAANHNVYHFTGNARFGGNSNGDGTFATWQAQGMDANGIVADPLLRSVAPGQEDLRLGPNSPCTDRVPQQFVNVDILGTARPAGAARDAGAHEFVPGAMSMEYGVLVVPFAGNINVGGIGPAGSLRTFTIRNAGPGNLEFTADPRVAFLPGINCHQGTHMTVQPPASIPPAGAANFIIFIRPVALGPMDLSVTIPCTDPLRTPFVFTVNATGVPGNQPAEATAPPGSALSGPPGGPFACTLLPGVAPVNVTLDLRDPEGDPITLMFSGPLGPAIAGFTGPAAPAPGQPLQLAWTGMPAATTAPGQYRWFIMFGDTGSQSVMGSHIVFTVDDAPPVHILAGATAGAGTLNAPYECAFDRGKGPADNIGLCLVEDPNAGQTVILAAGAAVPGNPGSVGFTFALSGPILTVAPAAMLTVAETGQHIYEARLTDGVNVVSVWVAIVVGGPPLVIDTPARLPDAHISVPYSVILSTTAAVGATTFALTTGALPDGLALDPNTGEIKGMPAINGDAAFTIEATDATGAKGSKAFTLATTNPPVNIPRKPSDAAGCTAGTGVGGMVAALFVAALRRRRSDDKALRQ